MSNSIIKSIPSKAKFKIYWKAFYPILIGSFLFALNGFVDNFMVGSIEQGGTALSTVNSWTNILIGILIGVSASGSVIMSQYYFNNDFEKAKQVSRIRYIISMSLAIVLATIMWIIPKEMNGIFLKQESGNVIDINAYHKAMENAVSYSKIIAIQWIFISISFNLGNQLRETKHATITMYWGIGTLLMNIFLNSILIYEVQLGVAGAAWASVFSRLVAIAIGVIYILVKDVKIAFNPITIFKITGRMWKEYFKRWFMFFSFSTVIFFVTFRNYFYDASYEAGTNTLGIGVSAMSVLALSGAIMELFIITFRTLAAMSAIFVGSELGKNNTKQAIQNAKELRIFTTTIAFSLSILLVLFSVCVPYMHFLSHSQYDKNGVITFDGQANLLQIRNSLFVVAFFYPIWIWFSCTYRVGIAGGHGKLFAFTDWIISGPIQLLWLALIAYKIIPMNSFIQENFWTTLAIFLLSDLLKLIFQEIWFHKTNWAISITQKQLHEEETIGREI